jgi:hypothetical protein
MATRFVNDNAKLDVLEFKEELGKKVYLSARLISYVHGGFGDYNRAEFLINEHALITIGLKEEEMRALLLHADDLGLNGERDDQKS